MDDNSIEGLKLCLNIFDYLSMMIFILDILLKWVDEFWDFWKNGWNNFDFLVTIMVSRYKLFIGQGQSKVLFKRK